MKGPINMVKNFRKAIWLLVTLVFLIGSGLVFAQSSAIVTVQSGEVITGDKFAGGQIINNEGTIKGDFFFWGQTITSKGIVAGDAIGMGQDVNLSGDVLGNVRAGGGTVTLANKVGKNVNICGGVLNLTTDSVIGGNLIAFSGQINVNGKVKGSTLIGSGNITLNGEFFGDVNVNDFGFDKNKDWEDGSASLKVLPGTIIHGKLKFRGGSVDIQKGAQVADFQWVKSKITPRERQTREIYRYIWKFVRLLFTTAVYFLLGLLLLKLFPAVFTGMMEFSARKPWNAIGYGLIALVAIVGAFIAFIILLVMSLIMSPTFGLVFGLTAIAFYIGLFFLATIPAALWLGGLIGKEKWNTAYRFAAGLIILNFGLFGLDVLGKVPVVGPIFPAFSFIIKFGAIMLGSGALLYGIRQLYLITKQGD
jgi:hypothetical protein